MTRPTIRLVALLLACRLLPAGAEAQTVGRPEFVGVRVGIGDRYKVGLWTPVDVTLRGGSGTLTGRVSLVVPDGDGVPSRVSTPPDRPCQVLPGGDTTVRLYVRFGRIDGTLEAAFHVGGRVVARRTFEPSLRADRTHFLEALELQKLIVTVGAGALGIEEAAGLSGLEPEDRAVVARVEDLRELPTRWYGYEGVDAVVISTSRPEIYRRLTPEGARLEALDRWVRLGGKLVLCVGAEADEVLHAGSALARFAPGKLAEVVTLRQMGALESYAGGSSPVPQPTGGGPVELRVPRLAEVSGKVEAREADLPLVVRTAHGLGQIVFVAADLDRPPLAQWSDRPRLLARLLGLPAGQAEEGGEAAAIMHYGFNDMAGQLRSSLDRFTGVRLVPFWWVAMLIVVYILLIGPGDYFLLRKVVGRMEWTWLTFPAIVLGVSLGAYVLAYRLKGDQLRLNQVDLVDVDAASGRARGTTWVNVFSPRTESFHLSLRPRLPDGGAAPQADVLMGWLGLPGSALGGMNPRAAGPALWDEPYDFSPGLDAIEGVPIQVWSTKSFTARWEAAGAACPRAKLVEEDQLPVGTITNTLDVPLGDCVLAYGRWAYELGTLAPGQSAELGPTTKRSELRTLLTGRKIAFDDASGKYRHDSTPYDQSSVDAATILRLMMFHEAAGGRRHTGLGNAYQSFVDFTDLLKTDRAVLVAAVPDGQSADRPGADLLRDGRPLGGPQDRRTTFCRFVFPVESPR